MRKIHILLAEDNRGDVLLVSEALLAHNIPHELRIAADGAEAMDLITRMGQPGEASCPDILLLDLNLPRIDGQEVLREFRRHPVCGSAPVIVLSSADRPADRETVRALGVTRYFKKPNRFDAFMELGAMVRETIEETGDPL
jgi:CheY-like chemotaxis protein